ncbi:MAG TPA: type II secretion system protein [Armatimonadota bacterium]|nr:type II secretion system protein [Armatimonadota bacterium]
MKTQKPMGFTIAELLVTVAIIAVLAVMVVPVFKARSEEARTLTCQSNMQRIVTAIRLYMADNDDTMPPDEHRMEVIEYFQTVPGGHPTRSYTIGDPDDRCNRDVQANPYLRYPVILDSYVRKSVWQCPSATLVSGGGWIVPEPDWLSYLKSYQGDWGKATPDEADGPCHLAWPKGWGGEVTDSLVQHRLAVPQFSLLYGVPATGAFIQSIGTTRCPDLTLAEVADASSFVIAGDAGNAAEGMGAGVIAYPEICALPCGNEVCGFADWEACAEPAADCGLYRQTPRDGSFLRNVSLRTPYARHRGRFSPGVPMWQRSGVNIGFLDGHVRWIASEALLDDAKTGAVSGLGPLWGPSSQCGFAELYPGVPTLY